MYEIIHYLDQAQHDLYQDWLDSLRDRVAKLAIIKRVARLEVACAVTASPCAMGSGNCASMWVPDTASISRTWATP